jgi:hypothetical protein
MSSASRNELLARLVRESHLLGGRLVVSHQGRADARGLPGSSAGSATRTSAAGFSASSTSTWSWRPTSPCGAILYRGGRVSAGEAPRRSVTERRPGFPLPPGSPATPCLQRVTGGLDPAALRRGVMSELATSPRDHSRRTPPGAPARPRAGHGPRPAACQRVRSQPRAAGPCANASRCRPPGRSPAARATPSLARGRRPACALEPARPAGERSPSPTGRRPGAAVPRWAEWADIISCTSRASIQAR